MEVHSPTQLWVPDCCFELRVWGGSPNANQEGTWQGSLLAGTRSYTPLSGFHVCPGAYHIPSFKQPITSSEILAPCANPTGLASFRVKWVYRGSNLKARNTEPSIMCFPRTVCQDQGSNSTTQHLELVLYLLDFAGCRVWGAGLTQRVPAAAFSLRISF